MSHKLKALLLVSFLFIGMNAIVYITTQINQEERIKITMDSHLDKLKTHYEIVLEHQKLIANAIYKTTIIQEDVVDIFSKAWKTSDEKERAVLREQLYNLLKTKYDIMKTKGVLQYHFVFPDNKVFLRMHKPSKYNDDLGSIRFDFKNTNEIKKINRGLSPGRTAHAFRNIYPVYDKDKNYIGALDVAFPSEVLQDSLTSISKIHTHFIISKHVFDFKSWNRDDMVLKYQPSAECNDYFLTMTKEHTANICINKLGDKLKKKRDDIRRNILRDKPFSFYYSDEKSVVVASFLPIKHNITSQTIAWLVTYENDEFISKTLQSGFYIRLISFFIFLLLAYFIYKIINQKEILNIEVDNKTKELKEFNQNLEQKVKDEVAKNMENELEYSKKIESHLDKERYLRTIMSTVSDINQYLITQESLEELLQITCERFVKQHHYQFCYIGLLEKGSLVKNYFSKDNSFAKEFMSIVDSSSKDKFSNCPVKNSIEKNHEVIINDVVTYDIDDSYRDWAKSGDFTSLVSFPLKKDSSSEVFGVIVVFSTRKEGFEIEEISMLEELSGDIGFAVNSFRQRDEIVNLHNKMMQNYEETILGFVKMIEQRDPYTAGHTARVANYSKMIAIEMGYEQDDIDKLYKASILHDIGKISTPDSVLLKPSRLNALEYELIQEHVSVGYEMLKSIEFYKDLADVMHYHHEHYDGTGYPLGLKGEDIPPLSAIMAVADAFDAMTSTRIYKKRKNVDEAIDELISLKGTQFSPKVVDSAAIVLKDVQNDITINQDPKTDIEVERLAYFYKDSLTGLYNENYLALLLNQKDYKQEHRYCVFLQIKAYKDHQVLSVVMKAISLELLDRSHEIISFRYGDDNIVLFGQNSEDMIQLIEVFKKSKIVDENKIIISSKTIDTQNDDINSLSELLNLENSK
ncbi:MAG: HD domain-containing protein [Campylobacterota bacterium]|nr:HD domain-containing protein [Campylobacterota bacterium]